MLFEQVLLIASIIGGFVTALFVLSIVIQRNDIADIAWGTGIFIVAVVSYLTTPQSILTLMLTILAGLWGIRLSLRIFLRNIKKSAKLRRAFRSSGCSRTSADRSALRYPFRRR